ncbi:MAG: DUF488 family protein [Halodesulfurarchaeum sp.]|nr:DUF488 family protein [Halodesulfurarchaeum sp.]
MGPEMVERGALWDTYAAPLQHDLVDLDGDERLIGVARRPLPWLLGQVDENRSALGPPPALLDAVKDRHEELQDEGLPDAEAHNRALEAIDYRERYLDYLENSAAAREAIESIEAVREAGTDVVLVCYENTDEKRCHRTILREAIEARLHD